MSLADLTPGELYAAAEVAGFRFVWRRDEDGPNWRLPKNAAGHADDIEVEMIRRWETFEGFVELKLLAAGPVVMPTEPCRRRR